MVLLVIVAKVMLEIVAEVMLDRPSSGYKQEIWGAPKMGLPFFFI